MNIEKLYTVLPPRQNLWVCMCVNVQRTCVCCCSFVFVYVPSSTYTQYDATPRREPLNIGRVTRPFRSGEGMLVRGVKKCIQLRPFQPFSGWIDCRCCTHWHLFLRYALLHQLVLLLLLFLCRLWFSMFALFGLALGSILYTKREKVFLFVGLKKLISFCLLAVAAPFAMVREETSPFESKKVDSLWLKMLRWRVGFVLEDLWKRWYSKVLLWI